MSDLEKVKFIVEETIKKMDGIISDDDFQKALSLVHDTTRHQPSVCGDCNGSGIIFAYKNKTEFGFRCNCAIGELKPKGIPILDAHYRYQGYKPHESA